MRIYAFSGLGADQRIFSYLKLDYELIPVQWIDPIPDESIESYADRLSTQVDASEPFALLGVSFGGMLASELYKKLNPEVTILISSAATKYELPWYTGVFLRANLLKLLPAFVFKPPLWVSYFSFPTDKKNRKIAKGIIRDMNPKFVKWAIGAIFNWKNESPPENLHHIHGSLDLILPNKKRMNAEVMGKGHFIILKEAEEISKRINKLLTQNS